jgi:hypothetical protein
MGAQPGSVSPEREFTHSVARPQEVSGAAHAEGTFGGNDYAQSAAPTGVRLGGPFPFPGWQGFGLAADKAPRELLL